jgi:hypothetical protein
MVERLLRIRLLDVREEIAGIRDVTRGRDGRVLRGKLGNETRSSACASHNC